MSKLIFVEGDMISVLVLIYSTVKISVIAAEFVRNFKEI